MSQVKIYGKCAFLYIKTYDYWPLFINAEPRTPVSGNDVKLTLRSSPYYILLYRPPPTSATTTPINQSDQIRNMVAPMESACTQETQAISPFISSLERMTLRRRCQQVSMLSKQNLPILGVPHSKRIV